MFLFFFFFNFFVSCWSEKLNVAITKAAMDKTTKNIRLTLKDAFSLSCDWDLIEKPEQIGAWMSYVERAPFNIHAFNHWRFYSDPYITDPSIKAPDNIDTDNLKSNIITKTSDTNLFLDLLNGRVTRSLPFAFLMKILVSSIIDLHTPLHTTNLFSREFPNGDRNGRDFYVKYNNRNVSLFELWETGCGMDTLTSEFNDTFWTDVDYIIEDILSSSSWNTEYMSIDLLENQLNKNQQYTKTEIYDKTKPGDTITKEYIEKCQNYTKEQMLLASQRLSSFFQQINLVNFKLSGKTPSQKEKAEAGPQGYYYSSSNDDSDDIIQIDNSVFSIGNNNRNIFPFTLLFMLAPFTFLLIWKKHCGSSPF